MRRFCSKSLRLGTTLPVGDIPAAAPWGKVPKWQACPEVQDSTRRFRPLVGQASGADFPNPFSCYFPKRVSYRYIKAAIASRLMAVTGRKTLPLDSCQPVEIPVEASQEISL